MNECERSGQISLSIQKLVRLGPCNKRREYLSLDLLRSDEQAAYRTELLKLQGTYFGKKEGTAIIENYIYEHAKKEWYHMQSQYDILLKEEAAYQKRLASFFVGKKVIARNLAWSYDMSIKIGNREYSNIYGYVHAMIKDENGRNQAIILYDRIPEYNPRACSTRNKPEYSPEMIAAYLGLKAIYGENLLISSAYTRQKNDFIDKEFEPKSQFITADFSMLTESELRERLFELTMDTTGDYECSSCLYESLCTGSCLPVLSERENGMQKPSKHPVFTSDQREVVDFKEGSCAVYAVPGAGKTTALVYRLLKLLDSGVDPQKILFVTFTNKACEEIKSRVMRLLNAKFDEELPDIFTYNGLGWQLLRDHQDIVGPLKLLTALDERQLLMECIDFMEECLKGYSYRYIEGKYGLISSLFQSFRRLDEDENKETEDLLAHGHDPDQIIKLKKLYETRLKAENYIGFDDQILLAKELLEKNPSICNEYGTRWEYIMADEYQDSSSDNVELLYLIADAGKRNIVVVGDTDQSIYEWRKGSPRYLLEFDKHYPDCKKIYMNDNFRSVKPILEASNELIAKNENRIDMFMIAHKECSTLPYRIKNASLEHIPKILSILLEKNYVYGDIAILSRANAPLTKLRNKLEKIGISCIGPSDLLIKNPVYLLAKDILTMFYQGFLNTDYEFYRYMTYCGCTLPSKTDPTITYYHNLITYHGVTPIRYNDTNTILRYEIEDDLDNSPDSVFLALRKLYFIFMELVNMSDPTEYVSLLIHHFHLDPEDPAILELLRTIDFQDINILDQLFQYLNLMSDLNDNRKMEQTSGKDKINLMTAHSSKGKEFPVVIILQAEDFQVTEEERRLLYVAMTRSKKCLFILESPGKECLLLNDIDPFMQNLSFQ